MRIYETTFIINPQTDDATIERQVKEVASVITNNQGKVLHEEHMGTRRLAYEINGLTQGYYGGYVFEGPQQLLPALDIHYRHNESFIRFLTVRFDGTLEDLTRQKEFTGKALFDKPAASPEGGEEGSEGRRRYEPSRDRYKSREPEVKVTPVEIAPAKVEEKTEEDNL